VGFDRSIGVEVGFHGRIGVGIGIGRGIGIGKDLLVGVFGGLGVWILVVDEGRFGRFGGGGIGVGFVVGGDLVRVGYGVGGYVYWYLYACGFRFPIWGCGFGVVFCCLHIWMEGRKF